MTLRLYTKVLSGNDIVEACAANNFSYTETGLFLFYNKVVHGELINFLNILLSDMIALSQTLNQTELTRAKNQLKSNIFMALEQRMVRVTDIGSQVIFYGKRLSGDYIIEQIDKLTISDLKRLLKQILVSKPTMLAYGQQLDDLPSVDELHQIVKSNLV